MTIGDEFRALLEDRLTPQPVDLHGYSRGSVCVRLLTDEQVSEARIEAFRHVDAQCKEAGVAVHGLADIDPEIYDRERMVQTIASAFVEPLKPDEDYDEARPAFRASSIRAMDSVTVDEMYDVYLAYQNSKTIRLKLEGDDLAAFAAALREDGNEAALSVLDETGLRALVMALVRAE